VLDGVSHWIPEQAPEALNELLLDHLRTAPES
jgi:pimeloyl-ACP methyl ester carboxylesterase